MYNTPGTKYHLALPIVPLRIGYYNEKAEPPRNVWLAQGKPYAERTWNCFRFLILLSLCASLGTLLACRHPSWACVSVPGRVMLALQCPWPHHAHHRPCPLGSHAPLVWVALRLPYWCPSPRVCPSPSLLPTQRPEGLSETWMGPQPSLVLNPAVSPPALITRTPYCGLRGPVSPGPCLPLCSSRRLPRSLTVLAALSILPQGLCMCSSRSQMSTRPSSLLHSSLTLMDTTKKLSLISLSK